VKKGVNTAAMKSPRDASQERRRIVIEYYEQHKLEFNSKVDAAYQIFEKHLVSVKYSTIYTWLDRHIRKIET
jgi:hypothetical protein